MSLRMQNGLLHRGTHAQEQELMEAHCDFGEIERYTWRNRCHNRKRKRVKVEQ
jgi:hypothetical protein